MVEQKQGLVHLHSLYAFLCTCDHVRVALDRSIPSNNIAHKNACPDTHLLCINVVDMIGMAITLQAKSLLQLLEKLLVSIPPMDILRWIFLVLQEAHNVCN